MNLQIAERMALRKSILAQLNANQDRIRMNGEYNTLTNRALNISATAVKAIVADGIN